LKEDKLVEETTEGGEAFHIFGPWQSMVKKGKRTLSV